MRHQPHARVFMTEATSEIGSLLLHNSVNVMTRQREELGLTLYPLFGHRESDRAIAQWHLCRYRQPYTAGDNRVGDDGALTFEFWDAWACPWFVWNPFASGRADDLLHRRRQFR
jgi:Cft2 family RNA processing exonuclease